MSTAPEHRPGTSLAGWVSCPVRQLPDRVFAGGDAFTRQNGWGITKTTRRFGLGVCSYRDPRFGPRTGAARQGSEYTGKGFGEGSR